MVIGAEMTADARIAEFVGYSAGVDRVTLANELGLPMPTVISAAKRLLSADVLVETTDTVVRSVAGRRPRVLRHNGPTPAVGVVSWRTDRLEMSCYDFTGAPLCSRSAPIPDAFAGAPGLAPAIRRMRSMAATQSGYELRAVVFSVPAPYLHGYGAPRSVRDPDSAQATFSVAAEGDMERTLSADHGLPVVIENDANLAALGELYAGAAAGLRNVVYLKINDQGFGSAIIVNGALARGAHGFAGELSHLQIDPDGPLCVCGGRGCLGKRIRSLISQAAQAGHEQPITFASLSRLAAVNDRGAARMLADVGRTLGRPLAHLCTFLDPERLIVDTSVDAGKDHVLAGLRETFTVHAAPAIVADITLSTGTPGLNAEVLGAVETLRERARRGRR